MSWRCNSCSSKNRTFEANAKSTISGIPRTRGSFELSISDPNIEFCLWMSASWSEFEALKLQKFDTKLAVFKFWLQTVFTVMCSVHFLSHDLLQCICGFLLMTFSMHILNQKHCSSWLFSYYVMCKNVHGSVSFLCWLRLRLYIHVDNVMHIIITFTFYSTYI